jgi:hypothetical protein
MSGTSGITTRHRFGTTLCEIRTTHDGVSAAAWIFVVQENSLALQPYCCGRGLRGETQEVARSRAIEELEARLGTQTAIPATVDQSADYRTLAPVG